jgi:hypothetical protein
VIVVTGLSFALPQFSPLHVTAHAEARYSQADVFNFALTGKLPVDGQGARFLELTPEGDVVTVHTDSPRVRFHAVESFYRILNADHLAVHHFDSILGAYALELSQQASSASDNPTRLSAVLLGMNHRITGEMMRLVSGDLTIQLADTARWIFRDALINRLVRVEDSLIAAVSDSVPVWSEPHLTPSPGLTDRPSTPIQHVLFDSVGDSLKAVRSRA